MDVDHFEPAEAAPTDGLGLLRTLASAYVRRPVRQVAVVGNAPLEPSAERAARIDASDAVIRVNGFALDDRGREPAVGVRTDVVAFTRGVRATPWLFRDYRDRLYLLVEPGRLHWEPEIIPDWWPADLGFVPVSNRDVILPLSAELGIDSVKHANWATTGTVACWLGRTLFPEAETLLLTGFSFIAQPAQTSWAHSYGEDCAISPEHLLDREGALLQGWVGAGTATLLA